MPYATQEDMEKRFSVEEVIQLTDKAGVGVFDVDNFAQAQLDGDAIIDSMIQSVYKLPLPSIPTVLVRLACDLYRFFLYGNQVPEFAQKRYDSALAILKLINKGDIDLNPDKEQQQVEQPSQVHFSDGNTPMMDRLKNF